MNIRHQQTLDTKGLELECLEADRLIQKNMALTTMWQTNQILKAENDKLKEENEVLKKELEQLKSSAAKVKM